MAAMKRLAGDVDISNAQEAVPYLVTRAADMKEQAEQLELDAYRLRQKAQASINWAYDIDASLAEKEIKREKRRRQRIARQKAQA